MSGKFFAGVFLYGALWVVASLALQEAVGLDMPWYAGVVIGWLAVIVSWEGD